MRVAPSLVRPLPFLVPTYGHGPKGAEALRLALLANDLVTAGRNEGLDAAHRIPRGRMLSAAEVAARLPGLETRGLSGGAWWTDAQVERSERLVLALLHSAASRGAVVANHVSAEAAIRDGAGRVGGMTCADRIGVGRFDVRARVTVHAAGPDIDGVGGGVARAPKAPLLRAWNLVLGRPAVAEAAVGAADGGRFLFLVPWRGRAIVGTGYAPADAPPGGARDFLAAAARAFPWAGIRAEDVTLVHEGLVPGTARGLWTRHRVGVDAPGLDTALGVKFTGARALAELAVDLALGQMGHRPRACHTHVVGLERATPLAGSTVEQAQVAVDDEMALTLADAVARRLPIGSAGPPEPADVDAVLGVMSRRLGWTPARQESERAALCEFYAVRTIA
jgi:glycerol-3-phosphate dehydrogenase